MTSLEGWLLDSEAALRQTRDLHLDSVMAAAVLASSTSIKANRPLLVCGNGGSAADAQHITGELVARFLKERRACKAICLASNPTIITAWSNDYEYETVFARQVEAYGEPGGILVALSTSGNSINVVRALEAARKIDMINIGFTGNGGGQMAALCDYLLAVPSRFTPTIQQVHAALYHYFCAKIEENLEPRCVR
jgi:D-sedoheptulose 7-phosphate isomerase